MSASLIKAGIVGVSGYSGVTVLEYLLNHPQVRVTYVSANNTTGPVSEIWPRLDGLTALKCSAYNLKEASASCDVLFLAVPHTVSIKITPDLLKAKKKVIDLSGDYRLADAGQYKQWYSAEHTDAKNLAKAVYGLPELYREKIKSAQLIANPGCYPTAALLGLLPAATGLGKEIDSVIIDAKSGTSGAGKKAAVSLNFSEVNENFKAYKALNHQHTPEIEQYLNTVLQKTVSVDFVPHLLPVTRGILATIYLRLKSRIDLAKAYNLYKKFYKTEPFVRIMPVTHQPELKNVVHTNFCDIGLAVNASGNLLVITSAIDNLVKGAAGQAIQNMNIMCNFEEMQGLL